MTTATSLNLTRRPRMRPLLLSCTLVLFFCGVLEGCGAHLSKTVSPDLIQRLPKNTRRGVFQAETVVTIAVDRKSAIRRELDTAEREIDRTREKIADVEKQRSAAGGRDAEKMDLEINMLEAKIEFLERTIDHLKVKAELVDKELLLARAQFELEKAKLVKKHAIAIDDSIEDFEEQMKDIQADVDDFRKIVDEDAADLKQDEERWLAIKKEFYSSIGESAKGWWTE
jgi:predicted  nucleic acid-binding Zn-ribbon protein